MKYVVTFNIKHAVFWDVAPCRYYELNGRSSETSVQFTISTWRHIPEDGILHSHRCGNLKSYTFNIVLLFKVMFLLPMSNLVITEWKEIMN
jgi:hypothetical protein